MRLPLRGRKVHSDPTDEANTAPPTSYAATLTGRALFTCQLRTLLWKHWTLSRRYWISTLVQLVAVPFLITLVLFVVQHGVGGGGRYDRYGNKARSVPGLSMCTPFRGDACVTMMYAPQTDETARFMSAFAEKNAPRVSSAPTLTPESVLTLDAPPRSSYGIVPVASREFVYEFSRKYPTAVNFAVVFNKQETAGGGINHQYQIWYNFTNVADYTVFDEDALQGAVRDTRVDDPFGEQLLGIMRGIDEAILSTLDASSAPDIQARLQQFPEIGRSVYVGNKDSVWQFGGLFLFLPTMLLFVVTLASIVRERSLRLRESMEMMGMSRLTYWLSTFLVAASMVLIQSLVLCLCGLAFQFSFFLNSNFVVVLAVFVLYGWAMMAFAMFLSTCCGRVGSAVAVGFAVTILSMLYLMFAPSFWFTWYVDLERSKLGAPVAGHTVGWVFGSLLPVFQYSQLYLDVVMRATGASDPMSGRFVAGPGFRFGDLYQHPLVGGQRYGNLVPMPNTHLLLLLLNVLLWSLVAWYLDHVLPDAYGRCHRRPLYFLSMDYWRGDKQQISPAARQKYHYEGTPIKGEDTDVDAERIRTLGGKESALRIINLTKDYSQGLMNSHSKRAVDRLCMSVAEGQLLALLGQNGAGKTTTMSMLYGALHPTGGDAFILGRSVTTERDVVRRMIGVCPQHDVLFADLTGAEHLRLYAGLKGVDPHAVPALIKERLEDVRLRSAAHTRTADYSGGMRRRLSLIIATIGDPKCIIMDEPTTGMDPVNRRHVWTFIERFKRGRVILLSTHLMEEADTLGDVVAVMAGGQLAAIGPSIHLKGKFGSGYRVTLVGHQAEKSDVTHHLRDIVPRIVSTARLLDSTADTLVYQIPSLTNLSNLIRYMEDNPHGLVQSWGITQTTLEEVFLRIISRQRTLLPAKAR